MGMAREPCCLIGGGGAQGIQGVFCHLFKHCIIFLWECLEASGICGGGGHVHREPCCFM